MPFPSASLPAPALAPYQFSYRGLTFGGVTRGLAYQLQSMPSGLDGAPILSGDSQRALEQGEFAGLDVYQGRDIGIDLVVTTDATSIDHARQQLGGVFGVAGNTEHPLYVQLPSGVFACMARPRKYNFPLDVNTLVGGGTVVNSLLHATDPRWYAAPSKTATVGLPTSLGGVSFPITFPVSFGGGGVGGLLSVYNSGLFEMRPVLVITGPCTNPLISNLSIPGAPAIGVNISLNTGDTLTIDTDTESVLYQTAGSTVASSRRNSLMTGTTWWNCLPANGPDGIGGPNQIEFNTSDASPVAGTLTVLSADAYPSL